MRNLPEGAEFSGEIEDAAQEMIESLSNEDAARLLLGIESTLEEHWPECEGEDIVDILAFVMARTINGCSHRKNRAITIAETFKRVRYWSDRIGDDQCSN